ncbi:MAG: dehydrogenase, partial [Pseudolabrys sp.]
MRAPEIKKGRRAAPQTVSARLSDHVTLEARANGQIVANFDGFSIELGAFSARVVDRALDLRIGLPLASFASGRRNSDKEIDQLVRRLARRGLLEYSFRGSRNDGDQFVVEPQVADYWPRMPRLGNADVLVLSRFAYMRRRGNEIVLESPRAGALFKICNPKIAATIAILSTPRQIRWLRRQDGFAGIELLALLVDCQILFKIDADSDSGLRPAEGDDNLVLWDFHDLLFHARSTEGRQANPFGGVGLYAGVVPPLPAVRPRWPGKKINLHKFAAAPSETVSPFAKLLHERHSIRKFDDHRPITLA